jgi:hypothetical protein
MAIKDMKGIPEDGTQLAYCNNTRCTKYKYMTVGLSLKCAAANQACMKLTTLRAGIN